MYLSLPDRRKIFFEYHLKDSRFQTILFVNGINQDMQVWVDFKNSLSSYYNLLFVDLIFQGKSDKEGNPKTFEEHAQDLLLLVNYLGLRQVNLVGISYGGAVLQRFMVKNQDYVNKVVLFSSFAHKTPQFNEMNTRWQRTLELGNFMPAMLFSFGGGNQERLALLKLTHATTHAQDYRPMLKNLPIPTLVVHGEKDLLTPAEVGQEIVKNLPNSQLVVLKNKSHVLNEEAVAESIFLIRDFFG